MQEPDQGKAQLLNRIADEADRGALCTTERLLTLQPIGAAPDSPPGPLFRGWYD
jgi:hypothetical protein